MKTIGAKIKELRNALGLSQEELAIEIETTSKSIQRYEAGTSQPESCMLVKLATYFDVSTDYLLGSSGYSNQIEEVKNKVIK